ncbi:hypothetical protein ACTOB_005172 [Actinoplanes oblitus]|uniref:Uncharacterized protein n=1 Tax=Actinoplanes oblitus TaxID=3040509 RepID=A0ABY8W8G3_9ACTN|nr:hypothetical protein [Actinoplanes oblitus]WIM93200.1 hypothetical protein ACTOB_005172 [Actinoplanes oblitus]
MLVAVVVGVLAVAGVTMRVLTAAQRGAARHAIGESDTTISGTASHGAAANSDAATLWEAIPGAFGAPDGATAQVMSLVRHENCFTAMGAVRTARSSNIASWTSSDDCRSSRLAGSGTALKPPVKERLLGVVDANGTDLWHGEAFAVITDRERPHGYLLKGHPGVWTEEDLPADATAAPTAMGPDNPFLLLAGRRKNGLATWLYSGWGWNSTPLPAPAGAVPLSAAGMPRLADTVIPPATVIVGRAGPHAAIWHSPPGGQDWQYHELTEARTLTSVVFNGVELVATGTASTGGPVVLTSTDGVSWSQDSHPLPLGLLRPFGSLFTTAAPSSAFVLGGPAEPPPPVYAVSETQSGCGAVYQRSSTAWIEEPLGCHGAPTSLLRLSDGRLAAAGATTLWLRHS